MSWKGFLKYIARKSVLLLLVIILTAYFTILVANWGGALDEIIKENLVISLNRAVMQDPMYGHLSHEERWDLVENELLPNVLKRYGLDAPFPIRSVMYLRDALTLNLGRSHFISSFNGSPIVRRIILERVPLTIALFTIATLISFFLTLYIGLYLSRRHGSWIDKLFLNLAPFSTIPAWLIGVFLIVLFAINLRVLPIGGILSVPTPKEPLPRLLDITKHMILPLTSWILSGFFLRCIESRSFFLIFSSEEYVEVARAKGLPPRQLERNYILRPALAPIVTSLALTTINSWNGSIILEAVFNWRGLGLLTAEAIFTHDTPVLIGIIIIYAYMLALTVLVLDIVYGIIDPRIKIKYS